MSLGVADHVHGLVRVAAIGNDCAIDAARDGDVEEGLGGAGARGDRRGQRGVSGGRSQVAVKGRETRAAGGGYGDGVHKVRSCIASRELQIVAFDASDVGQ
jgi:hypothetical protein